MGNELSASCTWGDGPDVLLCVNDRVVFLLEGVRPGISIHGHVKKAQIDLTALEARKLAYSLLNAAKQTDELNESCKQYFEGIND